jgi:hypothetical protein
MMMMMMKVDLNKLNVEAFVLWNWSCHFQSQYRQNGNAFSVLVSCFRVLKLPLSFPADRFVMLAERTNMNSRTLGYELASEWVHAAQIKQNCDKFQFRPRNSIC